MKRKRSYCPTRDTLRTHQSTHSRANASEICSCPVRIQKPTELGGKIPSLYETKLFQKLLVGLYGVILKRKNPLFGSQKITGCMRSS
jgi:hypothetical protein